MAAPTFLLVQGTTAWSSGSVAEFSTTGGAGAQLGSLTANINFSSSNAATGPQSSNTFSVTYPISVGANSYEFIWGLEVKTVADNSIQNMVVWAPTFTAITGVTFLMGTVAASAFAAPVNTASSKATTNFTSYTSPGTSLAVGNIANTVGALSNPVYMQVQTTSAAAGGNQSGTPTVGIQISWA